MKSNEFIRRVRQILPAAKEWDEWCHDHAFDLDGLRIDTVNVARRDALEDAIRAAIDAVDDFPKGHAVENLVCMVLKAATERIDALLPQEPK